MEGALSSACSAMSTIKSRLRSSIALGSRRGMSEMSSWRGTRRRPGTDPSAGGARQRTRTSGPGGVASGCLGATREGGNYQRVVERRMASARAAGATVGLLDAGVGRVTDGCMGTGGLGGLCARHRGDCGVNGPGSLVRSCVSIYRAGRMPTSGFPPSTGLRRQRCGTDWR